MNHDVKLGDIAWTIDHSFKAIDSMPELRFDVHKPWMVKITKLPDDPNGSSYATGFDPETGELSRHDWISFAGAESVYWHADSVCRDAHIFYRTKIEAAVEYVRRKREEIGWLMKDIAEMEREIGESVKEADQ